MPRASSIIAAHERGDRTASDTVILDYAARSAGEGTVTSVKGQDIALHLHGAARLCTDDLLVLDDGSCVEVVAAAEPLIEARAGDLSALARMAWHLGDRHIAAQLLSNRIRVRSDPAIEKLLASLDARVTRIEAPFEPEGGAYAPRAHDHRHDHAHDHGHGHSHGHDDSNDHGHHHGHDRHGHAHDHHHD